MATDSVQVLLVRPGPARRPQPANEDRQAAVEAVGENVPAADWQPFDRAYHSRCNGVLTELSTKLHTKLHHAGEGSPMTKVEQLIEVLKDLLNAGAPGQRLASVEELQDSIPGGAGIGTVIRAVQQAQAMGLPIVAVRGQEGGYFHGPYENRVAAVTVGGDIDLAALLAQAREIRRAVDDLIGHLEAAAA